MSFKTYLRESKEDQLKKGIEVEKEHKDLYEYFLNFLKSKNIEMPLSQDEFFGYIARMHISELNDYYDRLKKMEEGK